MIDIDLAEIAANEVDLSSTGSRRARAAARARPQPTPVRGDPALLERLAGNLVENSIRHNLPDGWFSVKTRASGDKALLTVANSGPVLPPEELERLFERFYRPDRSRSRKTGGFGLGLSIVKSVATAHGGTVELAGLAEGGLEVTVTLPASTTVPPGGNAGKWQRRRRRRAAPRHRIAAASGPAAPYARLTTITKSPSTRV